MLRTDHNSWCQRVRTVAPDAADKAPTVKMFCASGQPQGVWHLDVASAASAGYERMLK